jgi:hypothetical protein
MRWLLSLLLLTGVAFAQSQQPSPSSGEQGNPPQSQTAPDQKQAAPDTRGTEQNPIIRSVKSKEEAAQDAADHKEKSATDWWMIIFSGAVAVGAFLQVAIFIVMIRTSRRQLRAYLFVDCKDMHQLNAVAKFALKFVTVNTGQTPARQVSVESKIQIMDHPISRTFDTTTLNDPERSVFIIGAGKDVMFDAEADRNFTADEIAEITSSESKRRIYSYGIVRYKDIFGWKRYTKFCFFVRFNKNPNGTFRIRVSASEYHNEAN